MRTRSDAVTKSHDRICSDQDVRGLSQPAGREGQTIQVSISHEDDVSVPVQLKMLEPVVQHVDGGAKLVFGEPPRQVAIRGGDDDHTRKLPRKHERLVPGTRHVGTNAGGISNDHHTIVGSGAGVATAENRRPFAELQKDACDGGGEGRLAASAGCDVPDTDDRMSKPAARLRARGVPLAAAAGDGRV